MIEIQSILKTRDTQSTDYNFTDEMLSINKQMYEKDINQLQSWEVLRGHTFNLAAVASNITKDISCKEIIAAKKEYEAIKTKLGLSNADFKKRFPMTYRAMWSAYIAMNQQYPEIVSGKTNAYEEEVKEEIDVSQFEVEPRTLEADLYETVYEVPNSPQAADIIAAIIDKERPIGQVGDVVAIIDGKTIKLTQQDIKDEILVHQEWQKEILNNFKNNKVRFKITRNYFEIDNKNITKSKHNHK